MSVSLSERKLKEINHHSFKNIPQKNEFDQYLSKGQNQPTLFPYMDDSVTEVRDIEFSRIGESIC